MDQNLRVLFERALSDEPPAPPGDLALEAMAGGRRRRRRRHLLAGAVGGAVAVLATVVAVNVVGTSPATPTEMSLTTFMSRPGCDQPQQAAADIRIFLRSDVTDEQRAGLDDFLRSDPRVRQVRYESKEAAYARFKEIYRDAPDLVAAVKVEQIPESFQVTLAPAAGRPALERELERRPGVEAVVGTTCGRPAKEGE